MNKIKTIATVIALIGLIAWNTGLTMQIKDLEKRADDQDVVNQSILYFAEESADLAESTQEFVYKMEDFMHNQQVINEALEVFMQNEIDITDYLFNYLGIK